MAGEDVDEEVLFYKLNTINFTSENVKKGFLKTDS
jgi:hypothetical protein